MLPPLRCANARDRRHIATYTNAIQTDLRYRKKCLGTTTWTSPTYLHNARMRFTQHYIFIPDLHVQGNTHIAIDDHGKIHSLWFEYLTLWQIGKS